MNTKRRRFTRFVIAMAAVVCGLVGSAVAANGTPYYLDVNGTEAGFGDPSGLIYATSQMWSKDPTGVVAPAAFVAGGQLTFGSPGTAGISNQTFSVNVNSGNSSLYGVDVKVPCTVTFTALPTGVSDKTFTWMVVNGATLNVNHGNCNYNNMGVTLQGGGIVNFNTQYLGWNVNETRPWTQNMSGGTVNLLNSFPDAENQAPYVLTAGTLNFANAASAGAFSGLGFGKYANGGKTLSFNGGTVDNTSGSAMTLNIGTGSYVFGGDFTFAGSSSLNLGMNAVSLNVGTRTITVSQNTLTIGGAITNCAGLTKAGAGTLALTDNNTYSGVTTVNDGTLAIAFTDTTKQWTCASLTVNNGGSGLQFAFGNLTPSTTIAPMNVTGSVAFTTAPAITVTGGSLPVSSGNGYPLLTWGSGSPTTNGMTLTLPHRSTGNLVVAGSTLYLQITATTQPLSWKGGDGTWDVNNSANNTLWQDSATAGTYYQEGVTGDSVVFDNGVGLGGTITLNTNVSPAGVTANSSANYTFSGSGGIAGATGLTKSGAGTLTLGTTNTYSGATMINAGQLVGVVGGSCANSAVTVAATAGNTATLGISVTNSTKQWTCAALTVNNAGVSSGLDFDFGTLTPSTTVAPLKITGTAVFTTVPTVTVKLGVVTPGSTTYPLMTWGSGTIIAPPNVTVTSTTGKAIAARLTVSGNTLNLVIDVVNGTAYYLDVNGDTAGFGDPSGLIYATNPNWSTDPTGVAAPTAFVAGGQLTFGSPGTAGISNQTFSVNVNSGNFSLYGVDVKVPCTVTFTALPTGVSDKTFTWMVVNGATLNVNHANCNYNNMGVTLQGGGIVNFNTQYLGYNVREATPWTQNMSGGTVNLATNFYALAGPTTEMQAPYVLTAGTLNFATAASAGAFRGLGGVKYPTIPSPKTLTFSGGTVDNTSGSAMTLNIGMGYYVFGGDFTFAGSSSLNLNTNTVNLGTGTRTITVSQNTLTIGGAITNSAGLVKEGNGTLTLSGTNTYLGGTTLNAGTLLVDGSVTGAVNGVSGTFGGVGVVNGSVTNQAIITAAGTNSIGILTASSLAMKENSALVWNYNATTNDVIQVNGSLVLPAVATVTVSQVTSGRLPDLGVVFTGFSSLVTNTGTLGGWVINGARPNTRAIVSGNQVLLETKPTGTMIRIF